MKEVRGWRRGLTLGAHVQVKEDSSGNVKIASSNAGKDFAAEEISAQVLRKLTDDAAKFLNDKVPTLSPGVAIRKIFFSSGLC